MSMIDPFPKSSLPERNPITHEKHRQEVLWQITVPLVVGLTLVLLLLLGVIWSASGGSEQVSRWADVSLVFLSLQVLVIGLVLLVMLIGAAYVVTMLVRILPGYARMAQDFFLSVSIRVRQGSDKAVEPFLRYHSFIASVRALFRR